MTEPLLSVSALETRFPMGRGWLGRRTWLRAVDGVDLTIAHGETLGVVGESSSGKTTLGRSILRLVEPTAGHIEFDGIDLLSLSPQELRAIRPRMQVVFQDPFSSLSPRMQIGQIIAEPLRLHRIVPEAQVEQRVIELLAQVGLDPYFRHRYPHEMSGGQRQRIAIARALSLKPEFLVADEPVSALDVSVQAQILNILVGLKASHRIAMLFISHDLAVVARIADRIAVMYRGVIVEQAPAAAVLRGPLRPYTQALVAAVPSRDRPRDGNRSAIEGEPASATTALTGCPFASRCPLVQNSCTTVIPHLEEKAHGHAVACHLV